MLELAARQSQLEQAASKLTGLVITVIVFAIVVSLAFYLAERTSERVQGYVKYLLFLAPALIFLFIGLIGLGSEFPEMKYLNKYDASHSSPASPLASSP